MGGANGGSSSQSQYTESNTRNWMDSVTSSVGSAFGNTSADTFVDPTQQPFLAALRNMGMGAVNPAATGKAAASGARAIIPGLDAALRGTTALMDPTKQIKAQAASLKSGLGDLFRDEINPNIRTDAIASGGFGGGRQGVAEGVATGQLGDAFTAGYGDIVARANTTALGAAGLVPGLSDARYKASVAPTTAALDPIAMLASIIGAPTLLSRSRGQTGSSQRSGSVSTGGGVSRTVGSSKSNDARFGFNIL